MFCAVASDETIQEAELRCLCFGTQGLSLDSPEERGREALASCVIFWPLEPDNYCHALSLWVFQALPIKLPSQNKPLGI